MCITIAVSQIFKLFHAIKFDGQLHGLALRKGSRNPLSLRAKTYCSTNLLTQKVSQQLRSSMLRRTDFLNCHDSCDFNRLEA